MRILYIFHVVDRVVLCSDSLEARQTMKPQMCYLVNAYITMHNNKCFVTYYYMFRGYLIWEPASITCINQLVLQAVIYIYNIILT